MLWNCKSDTTGFHSFIVNGSHGKLLFIHHAGSRDNCEFDVHNMLQGVVTALPHSNEGTMACDMPFINIVVTSCRVHFVQMMQTLVNT